jgi:hypothetical protein
MSTIDDFFAEINSDDFITEIKEQFEEEERKSHPDYRKVVYCDKHLGVQMQRSVSHGMIEYGNASADVNPLEYWRCRRAGCDRSYEPTMFGYFWHSGEMGSRKVLDPTNQRRCGVHPGTPFMYVGKVGDGRRYLCPFYKCDGRGDEVQSVVVDEDVEIPKHPLEGLKKADRQRAEEMAVFESFVSASGITIDKGSAANAESPYPDIRCAILGKLHWFELGEIISEEVAAKLSPKRKAMDGGFSFKQERPFTQVVEKKATKKYETQGAPVALLLHFDLRWGSRSVVVGLIGKHAALLKPLVNDGPFTEVWIYDAFTKCIVWSSEQAV